MHRLEKNHLFQAKEIRRISVEHKNLFKKPMQGARDRKTCLRLNYSSRIEKPRAGPLLNKSTPHNKRLDACNFYRQGEEDPPQEVPSHGIRCWRNRWRLIKELFFMPPKWSQMNCKVWWMLKTNWRGPCKTIPAKRTVWPQDKPQMTLHWISQWNARCLYMNERI